MFQVNPFKDRICKVFSSSKDGELTFEDFLDMMSVFSENVSFIICNLNIFCFYDSFVLELFFSYFNPNLAQYSLMSFVINSI